MMNTYRISNFSRFLNKIPLAVVKPATRFGELRNVASSLKNAADETIWSTGNKVESLFHLTKKGKASQMSLGKYNEAKKQHSVKPLYKKRPKTELTTVHNHPSASSLSTEDLGMASPKHHVVAVDEYGSKYRAYPKTEADQKRLQLALQFNDAGDRGALTALREAGIENVDARKLAYTHARNRALKRAGLIHYSAQIKNPLYTADLKDYTKGLEDVFYKRYMATLGNIDGKYKEIADPDLLF